MKAKLNSTRLAELVAQLMSDKIAHEITIYDLREKSTITDYFVICTCNSDTHVQAVSDHIEHELSSQHNQNANGHEGYTNANWILLDYGDIVAHIFRAEVREHYDLDGLWGDAPHRTFSSDPETHTVAGGTPRRRLHLRLVQ